MELPEKPWVYGLSCAEVRPDRRTRWSVQACTILGPKMHSMTTVRTALAGAEGTRITAEQRFA